MADIIALLNSGSSEDLLSLTDAELLESCSGPISDEVSSIILDSSKPREVQLAAAQLGARILSLLPSDGHATSDQAIANALWSLTSQFGSSYDAYSTALKEAEEKVEKAAAEAAAAANTGKKPPAPSKGGAPPPPPPPSISIDDLLTMVPHKQSLDSSLSSLSSLIRSNPSSIDTVPQSALHHLPKLLLHHSPRIQIRTLVCLKLILSFHGAPATTLLSLGVIGGLLHLLRASNRGSVKKATLQVLSTLSQVHPSGPHLIQLVKQEAVKTLLEIILSPESSLPPPPASSEDQATPTPTPTPLDMTQPIPCHAEELQVASARLLSYLVTNSSTACRQLLELGGPNILLALIPHNLPPSTDGLPIIPIPFYPPSNQRALADAEDLSPLVLSNAIYPLPRGPSPQSPNVDTLQSLLLDCLASLVSSTCDLPAFISQGWTLPTYPDGGGGDSDGGGQAAVAHLSSPVTLLLGLLEKRQTPPPPSPSPVTPPAGAAKAGKASKGGANPVAEAPPPPPPPPSEPFPPSIRSSALRCLSQLARLPSHASEITSSETFRGLLLGGADQQLEEDYGVVEATALLLHSLLSFSEGSLDSEEVVPCLKRLTLGVTTAPAEYKGHGSIEAARGGIMRAMMALPDQGEAAFIAPPRPPPPSPPKSPPPPPLATSQFVWDALGRPTMTDGFKLAV